MLERPASGFAGLFSVAAGLVQAFTGEPTVPSLVLTIIGPTIISLWGAGDGRADGPSSGSLALIGRPTCEPGQAHPGGGLDGVCP
jgi:hypothetical protein